MPKKAYIVIRGEKPGVYNNWLDAGRQVNGFSGNLYVCVKSMEHAQLIWDYYTGNYAQIDEQRIYELCSMTLSQLQTVLGPAPIEDSPAPAKCTPSKHDHVSVRSSTHHQRQHDHHWVSSSTLEAKHPEVKQDSFVIRWEDI
jgi:hypothetical protein